MHRPVSGLRRRFVASGLLLSFLAAMSSWADDSALDLVDTVDLDRYQGLWYEIARLPNRFQNQCEGEVTARYTLLESGRVQVVNRCRTADDEIDEAVGMARIPDPEHPARLQVRFSPRWLSWLPWVWGDYQIIALDPQYRWAMVGEPSRKFLWILAREPRLPEARLKALLVEARRQGFDVDAVKRTRQE